MIPNLYMIHYGAVRNIHKKAAEFYEFKYDITKLLKPASENLLEVTSNRKHKAEGSGVL